MNQEMSDAGPPIEEEKLASSEVEMTREVTGIVEVHFRVGSSTNYGYFTSKEQIEQFERDLNEMMQAKGYTYNGPLSITVEIR
jgi:hypothetical protein